MLVKLVCYTISVSILFSSTFSVVFNIKGIDMGYSDENKN